MGLAPLEDTVPLGAVQINLKPLLLGISIRVHSRILAFIRVEMEFSVTRMKREYPRISANEHLRTGILGPGIGWLPLSLREEGLDTGVTGVEDVMRTDQVDDAHLFQGVVVLDLDAGEGEDDAHFCEGHPRARS